MPSMPKMSFNIKLGHRIASISVVVILGVASIAGIYLYGASVQNAYQMKVDAAAAIEL